MNFEKIRQDFQVLAKKDAPIYFDNACTTLKPIAVIEAMNQYYYNYPGCAGRSMHHIGKKAEERFELARHTIANFVNARQEELIFTKNTTEAINLIAHSLEFPDKQNGVVTTVMEHHSAFLPFYERAKKGKIEINIVENIDSIEEWRKKIDKKTRIVVVHAINNTLGTSPPLDSIVKMARDAGALVLIDGAQSVPHSVTDFRRINPDFLVFSGHKMLGPTGIGCLLGKKSVLEDMKPFISGGGTIEQVKEDEVTYRKPPHKFEGGIQNYAGAIGLGAAAEYLKKIGMENIESHERMMINEMKKRAEGIEGLKIYGNFDKKKSAIFTFNLDGIKAHQVTIMLDKMKRICTRSGVFCAQPAMEFLGAGNGAVRASLYFYNTVAELDVFFNKVEEITKTFRG